jgi:hypothetical protein
LPNDPVAQADLLGDREGTSQNARHARNEPMTNARKSGEPGGARTRDHRIKSAMLYQLSYRPILLSLELFNRRREFLKIVSVWRRREGDR